jgi:FKBP-type peptidyl-prolyl cis-trans isomerase FkpA
MKKTALTSLCIIFLLSACTKKEINSCTYTDSPIVAPQSEINAVQAYLSLKGISATQHPSGLFYAIDDPGTGTVTPGLCNGISVLYTGKLTSGTIFDQSSGQPSSNTLGQLIVGWQKGIPLIKAGGKIRLYIPPSLGYGSSAIGTIPPNSILIFEVELVSVI